MKLTQLTADTGCDDPDGQDQAVIADSGNADRACWYSIATLSALLVVTASNRRAATDA